MIPTSIDGTDITGATIDGTDVQEITVDGDVVFSAGAALPTQGLLHQWDWSAASSTTSFVEDLAGSAAATGSFNGFGTINGKQSGNFDTSQIFQATGLNPYGDDRIIATVFQSDPFATTSDNQFIWDSNDFNNPIPHWNDKNNEDYVFFQGNFLFGSAADANPKISLMQIDTTDIMRINGTQVVSGNSGSTSPTTLRFGLARDGTQPLLGQIGEVLMYELSNAPSFADIENYLAAAWGITI